MQLTFEEIEQIQQWLKTNRLRDVTIEGLLKQVLQMAVDKGLSREDILNIELEVEK